MLEKTYKRPVMSRQYCFIAIYHNFWLFKIILHGLQWMAHVLKVQNNSATWFQWLKVMSSRNREGVRKVGLRGVGEERTWGVHCVCLCVYMHACACIYIYTHKHTCTYTHIYEIL